MKQRLTLRLIVLLLACFALVSPAFARKQKKKIYRSDVPLITAISQDDLAKAREIVQAHPELNVIDEGGFTPLEFAIYDGYTEFAEELLKAGADPTYANKRGVTPLMAAAWSNDLRTAKLLLMKRVPVNAVDIDGETALMAALHNCPDGMPFSLDGPADQELRLKIDAMGSCSNGSMVQLLLDGGADPNVKSKNGVTALLVAAIMANKCGAQDLLRLNADPVAMDRFDRTPESESCGRGEGGHSDVCKLVRSAEKDRIGFMQSLQRRPDQKCEDCCAETVETQSIAMKQQ